MEQQRLCRRRWRIGKKTKASMADRPTNACRAADVYGRIIKHVLCTLLTSSVSCVCAQQRREVQKPRWQCRRQSSDGQRAHERTTTVLHYCATNYGVWRLESGRQYYTFTVSTGLRATSRRATGHLTLRKLRLFSTHYGTGLFSVPMLAGLSTSVVGSAVQVDRGRTD